ncbi:Gfo/Idh/MocA family oxidoreductase [Chelativorans sp.]|uniref:Gfo/Idh/MocA family protein n=1 Tax=Chelativorans sp. TaxID=2203393 RepID=UPI002810EE02|nr:Gfo/Idh/MocA family oxidoreductase [Chelativorans sp.]
MSRVFIIGAGFIGRAHAEAAALLGSAIHVADPSEAALQGFLDKFPEAAAFPDADKMLSIPAHEDDVVVVATPPVTHAPLAKRAFASGRHVLADKPLGFSLADGQEMLTAARSAGKRLGCASNRFLGYASTERARQIVQSGALGEIYHATVCHRRARMRSGIEYQPETRWFLDKSRSGGGVMMDWGVYDLTTFFHVLEPIKVEILQAWMRRPPTGADPTDVVFDVETHVGATLRVTTAAAETVIVDYERASASQGSERMIMEVDGLTRALRWDWIPWLKDGKADVAVREDEGGKAVEQIQTFDLSREQHFHHRPLNYFVRALQGEPVPALLHSRAVFGFAVVRGIYEVAQGSGPLTFELTDF